MWGAEYDYGTQQVRLVIGLSEKSCFQRRPPFLVGCYYSTHLPSYLDQAAGLDQTKLRCFEADGWTDLSEKQIEVCCNL